MLKLEVIFPRLGTFCEDVFQTAMPMPSAATETHDQTGYSHSIAANVLRERRIQPNKRIMALGLLGCKHFHHFLNFI